TGRLKEIAYEKIDEQTEALISMIGDNQVDYRFFIGFKLYLNEQEVSVKNVGKEIQKAFAEFFHGVNHKLMGDFVSMPMAEIERFSKMEQL
ncbi:ATP/GTP-binding protein, partial [Staphylococcus aureus]